MDIKNVEELLLEAEKLMEKYKFVPFGNSTVQNLFLLVQDEFSPARKLRAYLCRLSDRLQALKENMFNLREEQVKLKILKRKLEREEDELERELIQIKIERTLSNINYIRKLFCDALQELADVVYAIKQLDNVPNNRAEFEKQEVEHFTNLLVSYLTKPTQVRSLEALGAKVEPDESGIKVEIDPEVVTSKLKEITSFADSLYERKLGLGVLDKNFLVFFGNNGSEGNDE